MQINILSFKQLSPTLLYQILEVRSAVFVVEQACVYQDIDCIDKSCQHIIVQNEQEDLLGYCRIIPPYASDFSTRDGFFPAIGRVLVLSAHRGQGIARQLMKTAITQCHQQYPNLSIQISAQTYLTGFYQSLGFVSVGSPYLEDGIEHIDMTL